MTMGSLDNHEANINEVLKRLDNENLAKKLKNANSHNLTSLGSVTKSPNWASTQQ